MGTRNVLRTQNDAELLSYIINQSPVLSAEIDLPVQGESIAPYGKLIVNNQRYRNAFLNVVNLIGLTVIKRNAWSDPWDFTERGTIRWGQTVREIILDLVQAHDYNANVTNVTKFLDNYVPNALEYLHEINFQKFYATTTSDDQLAMAFLDEGGLFRFIDESIAMNWESWVYDRYQTNKYMLARRILDGTVTPSYLSNFATKTPRERVSDMKSVSNKISFRSPNYNPAGIRRATSFDDQILIVSTDFEASFSTEVMATSYFRDEADFRARLRLCDGFGNLDNERLTETLGSAFTPLTSAEVELLNGVPAVLISREWFMNYLYSLDGTPEGATRETEFFNPTTLRNNHFLHVWGIFSTSPFENATVFTPEAGSVTSVTVSPATASVSVGQTLQLSSVVATTGFVNQAVTWSVSDSTKATINEKTGLLTAVVSGEVTVTATSIYDSTKTGTATVTVV